MNELLHASGGEVSRWLEEKLPALGVNWWADNVVNRLTFQQQRLVEEKRIQKLSGLDLAAVLRVLDQNWSELAAVEPLPREARNWVKELQSVRNRWAHAPAGGLSHADAFRDADTLDRLLRVIGADKILLGRVDAFKIATLARMATPSAARPTEPMDASAAPAAVPSLPNQPEPAGAPVLPAQKFALGQLLCLRSNSSAVFPVLEVLAGGGVET